MFNKDFFMGAAIGSLFNSGDSELREECNRIADDLDEKIETLQVVWIGETINLLGETLHPDTDITRTVERLYEKFQRIDYAKIKSREGRKDYQAILKFFEDNLDL